MIADAIAKKDNKLKKERVNKIYTFDEYFKLEEQANYKNEFQNGKIVPMSNGIINHSPDNYQEWNVTALRFFIFHGKTLQSGSCLDLPFDNLQFLTSQKLHFI